MMARSGVWEGTLLCDSCGSDHEPPLQDPGLDTPLDLQSSLPCPLAEDARAGSTAGLILQRPLAGPEAST